MHTNNFRNLCINSLPRACGNSLRSALHADEIMRTVLKKILRRFDTQARSVSSAIEMADERVISFIKQLFYGHYNIFPVPKLDNKQVHRSKCCYRLDSEKNDSLVLPGSHVAHRKKQRRPLCQRQENSHSVSVLGQFQWFRRTTKLLFNLSNKLSCSLKFESVCFNIIY